MTDETGFQAATGGAVELLTAFAAADPPLASEVVERTVAEHGIVLVWALAAITDAILRNAELAADLVLGDPKVLVRLAVLADQGHPMPAGKLGLSRQALIADVALRRATIDATR